MGCNYPTKGGFYVVASGTVYFIRWLPLTIMRENCTLDKVLNINIIYCNNCVRKGCMYLCEKKTSIYSTKSTKVFSKKIKEFSLGVFFYFLPY